MNVMQTSKQHDSITLEKVNFYWEIRIKRSKFTSGRIKVQIRIKRSKFNSGQIKALSRKALPPSTILLNLNISFLAHEINAAEARHVDPLEEIGVNENNARLLDVNAQGSFPYHVYQHHKNPLEEIGVENSNFFDNVHEDPFKGLHDRLKQFWPFGDYKRGWLYDTRRQCPLCDSSVYSYCSEKLFHDSCCCHNSNNPFGKNAEYNIIFLEYKVYLYYISYLSLLSLLFSHKQKKVTVVNNKKDEMPNI